MNHIFSLYEHACFAGSPSCIQRHLPVIEKMKHATVKTRKWTLSFKTLWPRDSYHAVNEQVLDMWFSTPPIVSLWSFFLGGGSNSSNSCLLWGPPLPANLKFLPVKACMLLPPGGHVFLIAGTLDACSPISPSTSLSCLLLFFLCSRKG